jgi:23S rRNA (adenine2030-N6)-methyltransferase
LFDGWEALTALLPPVQKRGFVLIDPPYEAAGELERSARAFGPALKRFGHGGYLWWRPLKRFAALDAADAEARTQGAKQTLRADLWTAAPTPDGKLVGSSVLLINPPYGLEEALRESLPFLADALTKGQSGWDLRTR